MKISRLLVILLLVIAVAMFLSGCDPEETANTDNIVENTEASSSTTNPETSSGTIENSKPSDEIFQGNMADFSIEMFKKTISNEKNTLVSPLSIMLALTMTANGADGETLAQMETVLGGDIALSDLNEYLNSYVNGLPSDEKSKLGIANSIWIRDTDNRVVINPDFLQKNTDFFNASINRSAFNEQTVSDINNWVSHYTDGMIDRVIDEISSEVLMYLINAVVFDAEWQNAYEEGYTRKGDFTDINRRTTEVDFMHSDERMYLEDDRAIGFIKPYVYNHYSFVALLPNEGISIFDYVSSLTGEDFIKTIENVQYTSVRASLPKFKFEYSRTLNNDLISLGMPLAFDSYNADFSKMGTTTNENIYIGQVLHKTFIEVSELGTRAGAVTTVTMRTTSVMIDEPKIVRLDRPFLFAIIDNKTKLPVFIGTVLMI